MPVRTISTQQTGVPLDATHFLQLSANQIVIFDIEGEAVSTGAALYIQLLATGAPQSGTTKPLYSRLAVPAAASAGNNGFSFTYRPGGLDTSTMSSIDAVNPGIANTSAVYVAISSTDSVYTSVAATTQVTIDFEDTYLEIAGQTVTGDTTTAVDNLTVWADPGASHDLIQFQVTNNLGAVAYIMLFAYSPANGATPIQQWQVANGATITKRFGAGEVNIQQSDTSYVLHTGCDLVGSSTTQVLTKTNGTNWTMKAWNI